MGSIVVTGAASGIGRASAERLRASGHHVITVDRHRADVTADLGRPDGRQAALAAVREACDGYLHGLVTCAGLTGLPGRPGSELASVNYFGTVELCEGLRPELAATGRGAVVALSSHAATIQPSPPLTLVKACLAGDEERARTIADEVGSLAAYPATKLAVARWLRRQAPTEAWAGQGVRLNALAPGMTETPMVEEGRADAQVAPLLAMVPIPMQRTGRPEDLAALIEFLLGPHAGYLCGSVIVVDGGTEALLRPDDWPAPWAVTTFGEGPKA